MALIVVHCINNKMQRFDKEFDELISARNFIIKCGYSYKIIIEGYETSSMSCNEELSRVFRPSRLLLKCLEQHM